MATKKTKAQCGHSACSQHFIDTGKRVCVEGLRRRPKVSLVSSLSWTTTFELPKKCPECREPVKGFYTYEPACGRVNYGADGAVIEGEMPEYFDNHAHEVKCDACGHTFAEGVETHVESDTVERTRKVLGTILAECDFGDAALKAECEAVLKKLEGV